MKQSENRPLKAKIKNEAQSSSSEDDEDAELLTEELEKGFFKVLSRLKKKDQQLYDENVKYYPLEEGPEGDVLNKEKKRKKVSEKDYKKWLKGQKESVENDVREDLEGLHDFWASPNLNKDDQFLRDYILNKKFLDPDEGFCVEKELEKLSDEEKELQEEIAFEHKYNYRYENPDADFLKRYPNTVGKALSKENNSDPKQALAKNEKRETNLLKNQKVKLKKKSRGAEIKENERSKVKVFGKKRKSNCFVEEELVKTEVPGLSINLENKLEKDKIKLKNNQSNKTQPIIKVKEVEKCFGKKRKILHGVETTANIKKKQPITNGDLRGKQKKHKRKSKNNRKSSFGPTVEEKKMETPVIKSNTSFTTPKDSTKKLPTVCLEKKYIEALNRLKKNAKSQYQQTNKKNHLFQRIVKADKSRKLRHRFKNKQTFLQSYPIKDVIIKKRKKRHRTLVNSEIQLRCG